MKTKAAFSASAVGAIVALTLVACSAPPTADEAYDQMVAAMCRRASACTREAPDHVGTCPQLFSFVLKKQQLDAALATGRVRYDDATVDACLAAAATRSCNPIVLFALPTACRATFVGTVAPSGTCFDDLDCAAGHCDLATSCPGRCVPFGGACGGSTDCDVGGGYDCDGTTCRAVPVARGASCVQDSDCALADYCGFPSLTCVARIADGAMCGTATVPGNACSLTSDCKGLITGTPGVCTPLVGPGAACAPDAGISGCYRGLPCDGTCHPDPCDSMQCGAGTVCISGTCIPVAASGQMCVTGQCAAGLVCEGSCVPPMPRCPET